ncbi:hypothetical protein CVM73_35460 [Bradyrhizobium forestalis]|uniref:Uncharacterized protein n=1 Tax=Bradyrhizobium forestalis TaxID=1419263 RepID=A0A2M8QYF4_9BRAD|nr:hypothetical protein [Bradyrhizobium forestalis]PJG50605.1 hypothetical protein CVM73_35460 [Bradyrhizobium forestalis]
MNTLIAMVHQLPLRAVYSALSIGHMQLPYTAFVPLIGANSDGEDNLYLSRGWLAINSEVVTGGRDR